MDKITKITRYPVDHGLKEATVQFGAMEERGIGCARRVCNQMGCGFVESVYEKCMATELRKEGLTASCRRPITGHRILIVPIL
jgi:hypothetical protein